MLPIAMTRHKNKNLIYCMFRCRQRVIFQDHERAYFDSADWVLGKVKQKGEINQPANETAILAAEKSLRPLLYTTPKCSQATTCFVCAGRREQQQRDDGASRGAPQAQAAGT
jgi:hypothetical protein